MAEPPSLMKLNILYLALIYAETPSNTKMHVLSFLPHQNSSELFIWYITPVAGQVMTLGNQETQSISDIVINDVQIDDQHVSLISDALIKEICNVPDNNENDDSHYAVLPSIPETLEDVIDSSSITQVGHKNEEDTAQRFTFELSPDKFQCLRDETSSGFKTGWSNVMADKLHTVWPTCALTFKYSHRRKADSKKRNAAFWTTRAICRAKECVSVTIVIEAEPEKNARVPAYVYVHGQGTHTTASGETEFSVERPNRRSLSGSKRRDLAHKCMSTNVSPVVRCCQAMAVMTKEELAGGNTTACQTAHVISQAIYERNKKQQLHEDVVIELAILQKTWKAALGTKLNGFIQGLGLQPFYCLFYIQEQVELYIRQCRSRVFMHLDSTG